GGESCLKSAENKYPAPWQKWSIQRGLGCSYGTWNMPSGPMLLTIKRCCPNYRSCQRWHGGEGGRVFFWCRPRLFWGKKKTGFWGASGRRAQKALIPIKSCRGKKKPTHGEKTPR